MTGVKNFGAGAVVTEDKKGGRSELRCGKSDSPNGPSEHRGLLVQVSSETVGHERAARVLRLWPSLILEEMKRAWGFDPLSDLNRVKPVQLELDRSSKMGTSSCLLDLTR
ncbi:hypothetical protein V6N11_047358 [Hibiscus sabdariffa]|uniref:Uncharacterized protein n=1 Tax=Hibiscus sabdariffa TaxID=183260 RepID=A0ABR2NK67_9ROSI